jgi:hypothetical protein
MAPNQPVLDYDITLGLSSSDGFGYREIKTKKPQFPRLLIREI